MSYLVLARKYRPQKFSDVVGQTHITHILQNAMKTNRLSHAFLFTGTRGVGKTTVARLLAKTVNCANPSNYEPCNVCSNCTSITNGTNPDVIEIDGASNRGIDEIRNLQERILYPPVNGNFKVIIIDEVHMLTNEAFNALLKTLEEPPPYIIFIFATTEIHKVPQTIISRCQRYDFKIVPRNLIVDYLKQITAKENISIEENALNLIANKGNGSVRDSLSILDQVLACADADKTITEHEVMEILGLIPLKEIFDILELTLSGKTPQLVEKLHNAYNQFNINILVKEILSILQYFVWNKIGMKNRALYLIDDTYFSEIEKLNQQISLSHLMRAEKLLLELLDLMKNSAQPEILTNLYFIYISKIENMITVEELTNNNTTQPIKKELYIKEKPTKYQTVSIKQPSNITKSETNSNSQLSKIKEIWNKASANLLATEGVIMDSMIINDVKENNSIYAHINPQMLIYQDKIRRNPEILTKIEKALFDVSKEKYTIIMEDLEEEKETENNEDKNSNADSSKKITEEEKVINEKQESVVDLVKKYEAQDNISRIQMNKTEFEKEQRENLIKTYKANHPDDKYLDKFIEKFNLDIISN